MWDRWMRSAPAPCTCSTRASPRAGAWDATCSGRTSSTTSRTHGAASANTQPTSTTFRRLATGKAAITRPRIPFTPGGPTCPRISFTITRRDLAARALVSDRAAVDIDRLTGDECAGVGRQEYRRAADIVGRHVAFDHPRAERMGPDLF